MFDGHLVPVVLYPDVGSALKQLAHRRLTPTLGGIVQGCVPKQILLVDDLVNLILDVVVLVGEEIIETTFKLFCFKSLILQQNPMEDSFPCAGHKSEVCMISCENLENLGVASESR